MDKKIGFWNWLIIMSPKFILLELFLGILISLLLNRWYCSMGFGVGTIFFLILSLQKILARPPHVGLVMIWGRRIPKVLKEGWHLCAPYPPFMYSFTGVLIEKQNVDLSFSGIRCKAKEDKGNKSGNSLQSGGEISVDIFYTYSSECQGDKLINFIDAGGHDGVQKIIEDLIEEGLREIGKDYSWEDFSFARGETRKRILSKLTGRYTEKEEEEIDFAQNGFSDARGLGIRFWKFNIGRVVEMGDLHKAAEKKAVELQQREGEKIELDFLLEYIEKFKKLGIPPEEIWDNIQAERGKASKEVKAYRGIFDKLKIPDSLFKK